MYERPIKIGFFPLRRRWWSLLLTTGVVFYAAGCRIGGPVKTDAPAAPPDSRAAAGAQTNDQTAVSQTGMLNLESTVKSVIAGDKSLIKVSGATTLVAIVALVAVTLLGGLSYAFLYRPLGLRSPAGRLVIQRLWAATCGRCEERGVVLAPATAATANLKCAGCGWHGKAILRRFPVDAAGVTEIAHAQ